MKFSVSPELANVIVGTFGLVGGFLGGLGAWKSYRLERLIDERARSDEVLVVGRLQQADLAHSDHSRCVLWVPLVNRAQRRLVIHSVKAFEPGQKLVPITWSGQIDSLGMPQLAGDLLPVDVQATLFLRHDLGKSFHPDTEVRIEHNFRNSPVVVKLTDLDEWAAAMAA